MRLEAEVVARRARAVVRGEQALAGGKHVSGLEAGGEVGRPRTRASQGVGVSGVKRDCAEWSYRGSAFGGGRGGALQQGCKR